MGQCRKYVKFISGAPFRDNANIETGLSVLQQYRFVFNQECELTEITCYHIYFMKTVLSSSTFKRSKTNSRLLLQRLSAEMSSVEPGHLDMRA